MSCCIAFLALQMRKRSDPPLPERGLGKLFPKAQYSWGFRVPLRISRGLSCVTRDVSFRTLKLQARLTKRARSLRTGGSTSIQWNPEGAVSLPSFAGEVGVRLAVRTS